MVRKVINAKESIDVFNKETIIEGCTICIWENTENGKISIGWWRGGREDMPKLPSVVEGVVLNKPLILMG